MCTWFGHGDDLDGDVDPVVAAAPGAVLRLEGGDLDAVRIHAAAVLLPVAERIIWSRNFVLLFCKTSPKFPVECGDDDADKVSVHALPADLRAEVDVRRLHGEPRVRVVPSKDPARKGTY